MSSSIVFNSFYNNDVPNTYKNGKIIITKSEIGNSDYTVVSIPAIVLPNEQSGEPDTIMVMISNNDIGDNGVCTNELISCFPVVFRLNANDILDNGTFVLALSSVHDDSRAYRWTPQKSKIYGGVAKCFILNPENVDAITNNIMCNTFKEFSTSANPCTTPADVTYNIGYLTNGMAFNFDKTKSQPITVGASIGNVNIKNPTPVKLEPGITIGNNEKDLDQIIGIGKSINILSQWLVKKLSSSSPPNDYIGFMFTLICEKSGPIIYNYLMTPGNYFWNSPPNSGEFFVNRWILSVKQPSIKISESLITDDNKQVLVYYPVCSNILKSREFLYFNGGDVLISTVSTADGVTSDNLTPSSSLITAQIKPYIKVPSNFSIFTVSANSSGSHIYVYYIDPNLVGNFAKSDPAVIVLVYIRAQIERSQFSTTPVLVGELTITWGKIYEIAAIPNIGNTTQLVIDVLPTNASTYGTVAFFNILLFEKSGTNQILHNKSVYTCGLTLGSDENKGGVGFRYYGSLLIESAGTNPVVGTPYSFFISNRLDYFIPHNFLLELEGNDYFLVNVTGKYVIYKSYSSNQTVENLIKSTPILPEGNTSPTPSQLTV